MLRLRVCLAWLLAWCLMPAGVLALPAGAAVDIGDLPPFARVDGLFWHLEDPAGELGIDDLIDPARSLPFQPGTDTALNKGFSQSAFWLVGRFRAAPDATNEKALRYLEVDYSLLDDIRYYVVVDGKVQQRWLTGDTRPFDTRPIDHSRFLFPLELRPGEEKTVLFRVQSTSSLRMPLSFWDPFQFYHTQRIHLLIDGIYYGIIFLMFFYNLCLLITVRDISYFYYIGYTFSLALFQLGMTGYGFEYLWSRLPVVNSFLIPFSICLIAASILKFSQRVLDLKKNAPHTHRFFNWVVLLQVAGMVASLSLSYQLVIKPVIWCAMVVASAMLFVSAAEAWKGSHTARLFLIAWASLLLGSMILAFASMGWIPANLVTTNAFMLGSAIEVTLLSITLAERLNQINRQKADMEKEAKRALEIVNQTLQDNNRIKDEFLATISHELRTPMNGVLGCLQHIHDEPISDKASQYLNYADRSARHMMLLVDSLLTYTELQSGKLVLDNRPFTTRELLASARSLFTELSQKKGIALNFFIEESTPDVLISDCVRLSQILNNLLDNAIKFTRHGRVEVRIQGESANPASTDFQLIMQVSDTGIGIAEDKLALIFERFRQVDGAFNRGYGGLGIGLAVIKSLLGFLGGAIDVESTPGKGTTFTVHIPCHRQPAVAEEADVVAPERSPASLRILVVEDNPVNQLVLKGLLQKQGYSVVTADNGIQAVQLVQSTPVDAILMDCQMPELDGFEATRQIRALPLPVSKVPIIAVTANAMSQDRERCVEAGMNDYTSKPIDARALNKKIIYWVNLPGKTQKAG